MSTILFIVVVILLLATSVGLQVLRTRRAPLGKVQQVFSNLRYDEKLCKELEYSRHVRKFRVSGWARNKAKVRFLPEEMRHELDGVFGLMEDANAKIDTAVKFRSNAYLVDVDVKKLEQPLVSARDKLQKWLQANMHNPAYLPRRLSLFRW